MILFKTWMDCTQQITCAQCAYELNVPEEYMRRMTQDEAIDMERVACTRCGMDCIPEEVE